MLPYLYEVRTLKYCAIHSDSAFALSWGIAFLSNFDLNLRKPLTSLVKTIKDKSIDIVVYI